MEDLQELCAQWVALKEQERATTEWRRDIEDQLIQRLKLDGLEGAKTTESGSFKIVATARVDKKVDAQHVREIAAENGCVDQLGKLFRWEAKIKAKDWNKADPQIIEALGAAITEKVSRPSFKIEEI